MQKTLARRQDAPRAQVPHLAVLLMTTWLLSAWSSPAWAQPKALTQAERDQLYSELAREYKVFEKNTRILKRVVKVARPTVVHIEVNRSGSVTRGMPEETGSGVIIRLEGKYYVLTNRHLVRGAAPSQIGVRLADGRELTPTAAWSDPGTDVATLAITGTNLQHSRIGNSEGLEIGDFVMAIGSPFGLNHSVTYGIISAMGRRDLRLATDEVNYQDFLQTDASINPGNSGGPLVNLRGELIGINTAIASIGGRNEGIGFSIPINMVMFVAEQLIEKGKVIRGYLGVWLDRDFGANEAVKLGIKIPGGARIRRVTENSPAAKADLREGDVILSLDGIKIDDDSHLINQVALTPVGETVSMVIFRDGDTQTVDVEVGNRADYEQ